MTTGKSLQKGSKAAFQGGYTSKSALQTRKEPLAQDVLGLSHPESSNRRDLLQFRPSTDDERELVNEFFEYMIAEGGGWHGSCCFFGP